MPGTESIEADISATTAELERLVRRLRSLSPRAWPARREPTQAALAGLVALSAQLEGRVLEPPVVADHVLADAIAVVGGDVLERLAAKPDRETLDAVARVLDAALAATR